MPTSFRRAFAPIAFAAVFILLLIGLRVALFKTGTLFGDEAALYSNIVVGGLIAIIIGLASFEISRRGATSNAQSGSPISVAAGLIGVVAAAIGLVQLVVPTTPTFAAAAACRGVPVEGAAFLGQTPETGVNARAGAGTGFVQVNRFSGGCTLGFEGYCIGEPIDDTTINVKDTRWLIVARQDYLITSARIQGQSMNAALGNAPSEKCTKFGGLPQPGVPQFSPSIASPALVSLKSTATSAALIGYAVRVLDPKDQSYPYSIIGIKDNAPDFSAEWNAATAVPFLAGGNGQVEVAATSCLAAGAPAAAPAVYLATFVDGQLTELTPSAPENEADAELLAQTACSGPP